MALKIAAAIDRFNILLGRAFAWFSLGMVVFTFLVVILRYFFGLAWSALQEVSIYLHASLFLGAAGFTLLRDGHVRVDIFYREMTPAKKAWVDLLGSLFLLLPTLGVIFYQSTPYILDSWSVLESAQDAGGIPAVFLLKTMIFVFCGTLFIQALSTVIKSWKLLHARKGRSSGG